MIRSIHGLMTSGIAFVSAALVVIAPNVMAQGHNHITVDTESGVPGDQVIVRAGYNSLEGGYSIDGAGRLLFNGEIKVYEMLDQLTQSGELHDWYASDALLLTADFYFATGRLNGGDFQWELAAVEPVPGGGGQAEAVVAWGSFNASGLVASDRSDAATRGARSYHTAPGSHAHAQGFAASARGLYDLTFIAWDSNGVYEDSEPVIVRLQAGEPMPCVADFDGNAEVDILDFLDFIDAFSACEGADAPCPSEEVNADVNGDTTVDILDFLDFIDAFGAGACP